MQFGVNRTDSGAAKPESAVMQYDVNRILSWYMEQNAHTMVADSEKHFVEYCLEQLEDAIQQDGGLELSLQRSGQTAADDLPDECASEVEAADAAARLCEVPELMSYLAAG